MLDSLYLLHPLDWDTQQLGISAAKLELSAVEPAIWRQALEDARRRHFKLLYCVMPEAATAAAASAKAVGGILVDYKVTYVQNTSASKCPAESVEIYADNKPGEVLIQLAYESGKYSRFRTDPYMTEQQFQHIYHQWITNAVKQVVADRVLVMRDPAKKIIGMVTLGEKNQRGDIGLLAVDETARGKGVGMQLMRAAQYYFSQKKYLQSQVVTQAANIPACRLYEKSGYTVEKTEYFFHFWL